MSMEYNDALKRLKEERIRLQLAQEQISRYMRMSQSHYSKAELGNRRFTYYELQCLCETEVDVYYVHTGRRLTNLHGEVWKACNYKELLYLLSIICVVIMYICQNEILDQSERQRIREMYRIISETLYQSNKNIFYQVRKLFEYTQQEMAERLEVDIKKLRSLENGKALPDSELVWKLYKEFNISPAIVLKDKYGLICEISALLVLLRKEEREATVKYLKMCKKAFLKTTLAEEIT